MKAFGLEIRKSNSLGGLYRDVDATLAKHNIPSGSVNAELQVQTVAHSLQKMLKTDRYFSVCTIRDCVNVCQIIVPKERMDIYQAAHCINWNEMMPDYREMLIAMILDDFRTVLNYQEASHEVVVES